MIQIEEDKFKEVIGRVKGIEQFILEQINKDGRNHTALEWNLLLSTFDTNIKIIAKLLGRKDEPNKNTSNQEVSRISNSR